MVTSAYIRDYLLEKFAESGKISASNKELVVPSIFIEDDWKCHMSINLDTGLWQCFKTGNVGSFVKLYSELEKVTYKKAQAELLFKSFLMSGDQILDESDLLDAIEVLPQTNGLEDTKLFEVLPESYDDYPDAWLFLMDRKLFNFDNPEQQQYFVTDKGRYRDRLIIPFIENNSIFYFQARSLKEGLEPKYLNPLSTTGLRPSAMLFPYDEESSQLVVCEGPLDAISLQIRGVNATCTLGSHISELQMDILRHFPGRVVLGYDNDEAGYRGIEKSDQLRKRKLMNSFYILHPPTEFKDWNEAHISGVDLKDYAETNQQKYDYSYKMKKSLNSL